MSDRVTVPVPVSVSDVQILHGLVELLDAAGKITAANVVLGLANRISLALTDAQSRNRDGAA